MAKINEHASKMGKLSAKSLRKRFKTKKEFSEHMRNLALRRKKKSFPQS